MSTKFVHWFIRISDSDSKDLYRHIKRSQNENKNEPVQQLLTDDKNTYTFTDTLNDF